MNANDDREYLGKLVLVEDKPAKFEKARRSEPDKTSQTPAYAHIEKVRSRLQARRDTFPVMRAQHRQQAEEPIAPPVKRACSRADDRYSAGTRTSAR